MICAILMNKLSSFNPIGWKLTKLCLFPFSFRKVDVFDWSVANTRFKKFWVKNLAFKWLICMICAILMNKLSSFNPIGWKLTKLCLFPFSFRKVDVFGWSVADTHFKKYWVKNLAFYLATSISLHNELLWIFACCRSLFYGYGLIK